MPTNWEKVIVKSQLVSLPDVYLQLKQILDRNDYALADFTDLISHDPGLSARLLRIANSAFFGFASKIDRVHHAISILGTQQLHDLVLATSVADTLGKYASAELDMQSFWRRSVYRAICARQLASMCNVLDSERLFVTGLLSGIGHLMMYQAIPQLTQEALHESESSGQQLYQIERQKIGFDHAMVAAALLKKWQLPENLTGVIENHLQPTSESNLPLETSIVHIASLMSAALGNDRNVSELLTAVDASAWQATGLSVEQCAGADALIREQLNEVLGLLFPDISYAA